MIENKFCDFYNDQQTFRFPAKISCGTLVLSCVTQCTIFRQNLHITHGTGLSQSLPWGFQSLTYSALWKIKIRTIFLRTSNGIASIWMAWIIIWMNIFKLALMKTSGFKASISSSKQPCTGQICFCLKTQCHHIFYICSQTCSWGHLYLAVTFFLSVIENFIWIEPLLRGHLS